VGAAPHPYPVRVSVTSKRVWPIGLLTAAAFLLLSGAWALALPVNGTYDENQHIVRAYAVVTGRLLPTGNAVDSVGLPAEAFAAPRSLLPENAACTWWPKPPKPASCQHAVTDRSTTEMPSQAARYSPVYYLLVGLPLRISPDLDGVVAARLLSALLSACLLGAAAAIAARLGNRLLLAALVLVSTPLVLNLAGSVNPNGLEISAGVLLFTALLALVRGQSPPERRVTSWLLAAAGVSGALLMTAKQESGPVLFAGVVAACLLVGRRPRLAELVRDRRTWAVVGAPVAVAAAFAAWWLSYSSVTNVKRLPGHGLPYGTVEILRRLPGTRFRFYLDQVVARFSYGETGVSELMIIAWYALIAALVLPALWLGTLRLRLAIAGIFVVCLGLLVTMEVHYVPTYGWYSQSRYVMALGAGIVLLAPFGERMLSVLGERGLLGLPVVCLVAATVPLDIYALVRVMTRFSVGIAASFDPFGGSWRPPLGSFVPLVAALLGGVGLVLATTRVVPPVTGTVRND
jgi:Predicted membrane protein (DUF2142)